MPPKKNNVKGGVKPKYTKSSCEICIEIDCDEMVACDECDKWFHFGCVGVTSDIKNKSLSCQLCRKLAVQSLTEKSSRSRDKVSSKKSSSNEPPPPKAFSFQSSKQTSMTSRQKTVALQKLEEEQRIKLDILERKYRIMEQSIAEEVSVEDLTKDKDFQSDSLEYTLHWAKNVQKISEDLKKNPDKISITASDEERELLNEYHPLNAQSTLLQEEKRQIKSPEEELELAFVVEQYKKFCEERNKANQLAIALSERLKLHAGTKTQKHGDELSQAAASECHPRKVKFDQPDLNPASVAQQQMCFGQNFITRPESDPIKRKDPFELPNYNQQQAMQFDYRSSVSQQQSTNDQRGKNPSINVGYGQPRDPNDQHSKRFGTFETTKNQQPMNHGFGPSNIHLNHQQPMNAGLDFPIHRNIESQQQETGFPYQPMNFGASNNQQQSANHASSSNPNPNKSGYVGHVGPLTPTSFINTQSIVKVSNSYTHSPY